MRSCPWPLSSCAMFCRNAPRARSQMLRYRTFGYNEPSRGANGPNNQKAEYNNATRRVTTLQSNAYRNLLHVHDAEVSSGETGGVKADTAVVGDAAQQPPQMRPAQ